MDQVVMSVSSMSSSLMTSKDMEMMEVVTPLTPPSSSGASPVSSSGGDDFPQTLNNGEEEFRPTFVGEFPPVSSESESPSVPETFPHQEESLSSSPGTFPPESSASVLGNNEMETPQEPIASSTSNPSGSGGNGHQDESDPINHFAVLETDVVSAVHSLLTDFLNKWRELEEIARVQQETPETSQFWTILTHLQGQFRTNFDFFLTNYIECDNDDARLLGLCRQFEEDAMRKFNDLLATLPPRRNVEEVVRGVDQSTQFPAKISPNEFKKCSIQIKRDPILDRKAQLAKIIADAKAVKRSLSSLTDGNSSVGGAGGAGLSGDPVLESSYPDDFGIDINLTEEQMQIVGAAMLVDLSQEEGTSGSSIRKAVAPAPAPVVPELIDIIDLSQDDDDEINVIDITGDDDEEENVNPGPAASASAIVDDVDIIIDDISHDESSLFQLTFTSPTSVNQEVAPALRVDDIIRDDEQDESSLFQSTFASLTENDAATAAGAAAAAIEMDLDGDNDKEQRSKSSKKSALSSSQSKISDKVPHTCVIINDSFVSEYDSDAESTSSDDSDLFTAVRVPVRREGGIPIPLIGSTPTSLRNESSVPVSTTPKKSGTVQSPSLPETPKRGRGRPPKGNNNSSSPKKRKKVSRRNRMSTSDSEESLHILAAGDSSFSSSTYTFRTPRTVRTTTKYNLRKQPARTKHYCSPTKLF